MSQEGGERRTNLNKKQPCSDLELELQTELECQWEDGFKAGVDSAADQLAWEMYDDIYAIAFSEGYDAATRERGG